jgi:tetratricopeptide (TPR) repeat protein
VYSRLGEFDQSVEAYRGALALLEESEESAMMDTAQADIWQEHYGIARSGLAQALQFSGEYQAAADLYGEMLAEDPDNSQLIGSLASVLTELEMPDSVDALYNNLLNRPGLTEADLANAGVGLFRIEEYDRAAQAFAQAAAMNPFNRDARLNLVQTYFTAENWEAVPEAAQELLEVDPLNGFVWIVLARAYSELEQPEEANRVFNEYQEIGYEVENLMLEPQPAGGARVSGTLKNTTAEQGSTVTLRFHFGNPDGQEVGTTDIRVQVPAPEESVEFSGMVQTSGPVTGYMYEVVQ